MYLKEKEKDRAVTVQLSPAVYVALCGLVQDALEYPSDASQLLRRAVKELGGATANDTAFSRLSGQAGPLQIVRRTESAG